MSTLHWWEILYLIAVYEVAQWTTREGIRRFKQWRAKKKAKNQSVDFSAGGLGQYTREEIKAAIERAKIIFP
jgi:hypothetical protein